MPERCALETGRLLLRPRRVEEAATYRRLWTQRDARVPAHRRIDAHGHPTAGEIAAQIRQEDQRSRPGLLAVALKDTGQVIGYCGLVFHDAGAPGEPELAFELLREVHGLGYATEAGAAVLTWAALQGYQRAWATVRSWNLAPRRVLAKLGFVDSGQIEADAVHGDSLLMVRPF